MPHVFRNVVFHSRPLSLFVVHNASVLVVSDLIRNDKIVFQTENVLQMIHLGSILTVWSSFFFQTHFLPSKCAFKVSTLVFLRFEYESKFRSTFLRPRQFTIGRSCQKIYSSSWRNGQEFDHE
jgi:hypothetical protein